MANACSKCTASVLKCRTGAKCRNCGQRMALLCTVSKFGNCAQPVRAKPGKIVQAFTSSKTYSQYQMWEYICAWKAATGDGVLSSGNKIEAFIYILKVRIRVSRKKARKMKVITLIFSYICLQTRFSECQEPSALNNTVRKILLS